MKEYPGLGKYLKVGSSIGLVCFVFLWLGAILWPSFGDFIFAKYDLLTPYSIIHGLTGIVFDGPFKEGGILFVLLSWAIYTVLGAMLVSVLIYFLYEKHHRNGRMHGE
jgi:hypothetical protein